jgi:hypothetical protein
MRPLLLGLRPRRAGLEQQHVEAAFGELLGDDRAAGSGADDDDVTHASSP